MLTTLHLERPPAPLREQFDPPALNGPPSPLVFVSVFPYKVSLQVSARSATAPPPVNSLPPVFATPAIFVGNAHLLPTAMTCFRNARSLKNPAGDPQNPSLNKTASAVDQNVTERPPL